MFWLIPPCSTGEVARHGLSIRPGPPEPRRPLGFSCSSSERSVFRSLLNHSRSRINRLLFVTSRRLYPRFPSEKPVPNANRRFIAVMQGEEGLIDCGGR